MNFYNFNIFLRGLYNCFTGSQVYITKFGSAGKDIDKKDLRWNLLICYVENMNIKTQQKRSYFADIVTYINSLCLRLDKYIEQEK